MQIFIKIKQGWCVTVLYSPVNCRNIKKLPSPACSEALPIAPDMKKLLWLAGKKARNEQGRLPESRRYAVILPRQFKELLPLVTVCF